MNPQSLFISSSIISIIISSLFFNPITSTKTTIAFTTLGRSRYNFDIFSLTLTSPIDDDLQLTDGVSVNFNGFFPSATSPSSILHVSERGGVSSIYLTTSTNKNPSPFHLPPSSKFSFKDRPSISGNSLIYVSTHQPSDSPRQSWSAVYSTDLATNSTARLSPRGVSDFSPAVSPSGAWTAVASFSDRKWTGEVQGLNTSIYLFRTSDGSRRFRLIDHGGWPCWGDDHTLYFHRESGDGWWSVYRARVAATGAAGAPSLVSIDRVTPAGFHAFTPAASVGSPGIVAVATRRGDSDYRHIELVDLRKGRNEYVELTRLISPYKHHYNPFLSSDGSRIGYHRCRGGGGGNGSPSLLLENIESPFSDEFSLFRIDGSFPSFSHDGEHIAFVGLPGLFVVRPDGSGGARKVFDGNVFPAAWDWKRNGVIYTSYGPEFAPESAKVDVISVTIADDENSKPLIKKLTLGGENNAFPSPSPDGRSVVFRSGRSGHKNLYVMDSVEGESREIYRLTEGPWTDTMCSWSPDGDWIAFSSDRENPGTGTFSVYMIQPNGTGLRKVAHSGNGGRINHPCFSPDSKKLAFTSDYGGISAEPISNPHHYQPYGEIYTVNIDGSELRRLTHNSYEDGTPTWTPFFLEAVDVAESLKGSAQCRFDDCHWLNVKAGEYNVLTGTGAGTGCYVSGG